LDFHKKGDNFGKIPAKIVRRRWNQSKKCKNTRIRLRNWIFVYFPRFFGYYLKVIF